MRLEPGSMAGVLLIPNRPPGRSPQSVFTDPSGVCQTDLPDDASNASRSPFSVPTITRLRIRPKIGTPTATTGEVIEALPRSAFHCTARAPTDFGPGALRVGLKPV